MTTHDARNSFWGHAVGIDVWNPQEEICKGHGWLWPLPVKDDIILIQGKKGTIHLLITKIRYVTNVDDMFFFDAVPIAPESDESESKHG